MNVKEVIIPGEISFATFKNRPNRFLVNLIPDNSNTIESAFLHDPGRMKELLTPDARLIVRKPINSNKRKTKWDILAVEYQNALVTINSSFPNIIAKAALKQKWLPELENFHFERAEVTIGNSRLDFLLSSNDKKCFVEVKGVTLVEADKMALFPDAPTSRGTRHLKELIELKKQGNKAVVLFLCMREDPLSFTPNTQTDSDFASQLKIAHSEGVDILVYKVIPIIRDNLLILQFSEKLQVLL